MGFKRGTKFFVLMFFLLGIISFVSAADCVNRDQITSSCECNGVTRNSGYCCYYSVYPATNITWQTTECGYTEVSPHWGHILISKEDYAYPQGSSNQLALSQWNAEHFDIMWQDSSYSSQRHTIANYYYDIDSHKQFNPLIKFGMYRLDLSGSGSAIVTWANSHSYNPEDAFLHYSEDTVVSVEGNQKSYTGCSSTPSSGCRVETYIWGGWRTIFNPGSDLTRNYFAQEWNTLTTTPTPSGNIYDFIWLDEHPLFQGPAVSVSSGGTVLEYGAKWQSGYPPSQSGPLESQYQTDVAGFLTAQNNGMQPEKLLLLNAAEYCYTNAAITQSIAADGIYYEWMLEPAREKSALVSMYNSADATMAAGSSVIFVTRSSGSSPYVTIPSGYNSGSYSSTVDRARILELAMYYLGKDPENKLAYFDIHGGWAANDNSVLWFDAQEVNIGKPIGDYYMYASGSGYTVFARNFTKGLVLLRPKEDWNYDTYDDSTARTFNLPGTLTPINADGSLMTPTDTFTLRNSEAVILLNESGGVEPPPVATQCAEGEITSECQCGNTNASVGLCCDAGSEMIWFDPYYKNLGGCPSGTYYYVEQNNPAASDSNPGTSPDSPWLTFEKATNTLHAGDVVLVKSGTYYEYSSSYSSPAYQPAYSGTVDHPVVFRSYPGAEVNLTAYESVVGGGGNKDYIVIDGFKIYEGLHGVYYFEAEDRDAFQGFPISLIGGTTERPGVADPSLFLEGWVIMNNEFIGNHSVFAPYQQDNYCAIWSTNGGRHLVVRNNIIHGFTGQMHNAAGIITYQNWDSIFENNYIYDSYTGIYIKGGYQGNNVYRYNLIENTSLGLAPSVESENLSLYQNIVKNCKGGENRAVNFWAGVPYNYNSTYYNNVHYNCDVGQNYAIAMFENFKSFNNIVSDVTYAISSEYPEYLPGVYSDYNGFFNYDRFASGDNWATVGRLPEWKDWSGKDSNSIEADPQFVSPGEDFHLQPGSPMWDLGMDLQDYDNDGDTSERIPAGAYITGDEVIGLINNTAVSWNPPEPPQPGSSADVNGDGVVDIRDLALSVYWQGKDDTNEPNWGWFSHLDLNGDGRINWDDVMEIIFRI